MYIIKEILNILDIKKLIIIETDILDLIIEIYFS